MTTIVVLLYLLVAMLWLVVFRVIATGVRELWALRSRGDQDAPAPGRIRTVSLGFHPGCFHVGAGGELWSCVKPKPPPKWYPVIEGDLINQRSTWLNLKLTFAWWTLNINIRITKWRAA